MKTTTEILGTQASHPPPRPQCTAAYPCRIHDCLDCRAHDFDRRKAGEREARAWDDYSDR